MRKNTDIFRVLNRKLITMLGFPRKKKVAAERVIDLRIKS